MHGLDGVDGNSVGIKVTNRDHALVQQAQEWTAFLPDHGDSAGGVHGDIRLRLDRERAFVDPELGPAGCAGGREGPQLDRKSLRGLAVPGDRKASVWRHRDRGTALSASGFVVDPEFITGCRARGRVAARIDSAEATVLIVALPDDDVAPVGCGGDRRQSLIARAELIDHGIGIACTCSCCSSGIFAVEGNPTERGRQQQHSATIHGRENRWKKFHISTVASMSFVVGPYSGTKLPAPGQVCPPPSTR